MQRGRQWGLVAWLPVAALAQVAAFEVVRRFFVDTIRGQQVETAALAGNTIGQGQISGAVTTVLDAVSVLSVLAAVGAIGFIALMRGRVLLGAVATAMVIGANLTTQVLKVLLDRPELGVDVARAAAGNSLPSGHTTVTASVAVALVLVLPASMRAVAALAGAGLAGLTGVATLSAGWHRPSDAVAAFLVVGAWAAVAGLVLVLAGGAAAPGGSADGGGRAAAGDRAERDAGHRIAAMSLLLIGLALLAVAGAGLALTDAVLTDPAGAVMPEQLSRTRLFVAYAGGAAGIAATASLVMALVLATVHRVVPRG